MSSPSRDSSLSSPSEEPSHACVASIKGSVTPSRKGSVTPSRKESATLIHKCRLYLMSIFIQKFQVLVIVSTFLIRAQEVDANVVMLIHTDVALASIGGRISQSIKAHKSAALIVCKHKAHHRHIPTLIRAKDVSRIVQFTRWQIEMPREIHIRIGREWTLPRASFPFCKRLVVTQIAVPKHQIIKLANTTRLITIEHKLVGDAFHRHLLQGETWRQRISLIGETRLKVTSLSNVLVPVASATGKAPCTTVAVINIAVSAPRAPYLRR